MSRLTRRVAPVLLALVAINFSVACAQTDDDSSNTPESSPAPESTEPGLRLTMTADQLSKLVQRVDKEAQQDGNRWLFTVAERQVFLVYDETNDRMRLLVPIRDAQTLGAAELMRLLQANFDTALDARYAVAQATLWGTYIHPLSTLTDEQFLVAIGQTVNVANTYGESYSSGLLTFGGGDTAQRQQELIEQLRRQQSEGI